MCKGNFRLAGLVAGLVLTLASAAPVWAQQNNQGNTNFIGTLPAGVVVSPEGVLRIKSFTDKTGQLTKTRIAEAKARLGGDLAKASELRKVGRHRRLHYPPVAERCMRLQSSHDVLS